MIHDPGLQPAKDKEVKHVVTSVTLWRMAARNILMQGLPCCSAHPTPWFWRFVATSLTEHIHINSADHRHFQCDADFSHSNCKKKWNNIRSNKSIYATFTDPKPKVKSVLSFTQYWASSQIREQNVWKCAFQRRGVTFQLWALLNLGPLEAGIKRAVHWPILRLVSATAEANVHTSGRLKKGVVFGPI